MPTTVPKEITAAFIGGILAASAGWAIDLARENRQQGALRSNIRSAIVDDLETAQPLFDAIEDQYESTGTVRLSLIEQLNASRTAYDQMRKEFYSLPEAHVRRRLLSYYSRSEQIISSLQAGEEQISRLQENRERAKTLQDSLRTFIAGLDAAARKQPFDPSKVTQPEATYPEDRQIEDWKSQISTDVPKLSKFKQEAASLVDLLNQSRE